MSIINSYLTLLKYRDVMDLTITDSAHRANINELFNNVEGKLDKKIPDEYKNLLRCFDGGEIFVPGTIIYGLKSHGGRCSIEDINSDKNRLLFSIPNNYLIIGKMNFGDLICINIDEPHDVIQWDHERNEQFLSWDSLEAWIDECVDEYEDYSSGNK